MVLRTGAALAAAMGVGRFVFTPALPLMEDGAGLSPTGGSLIATANYVGYLLGAVLGIFIPSLVRRRISLRISGVLLLCTLVAMPLTHHVAVWAMLRGIAGTASAIVFMVAGGVILNELTSGSAHLVGWAYGGVGVGIAASGALLTIVSSIGDWSTAWYASAALTMLLLAAGWNVGSHQKRRPHLREQPTSGDTRAASTAGSHGRWFVLLSISYFFEGAGYIVAGTFLVAALTASGPAGLAHSVWIIVGVAVVPSCALWAYFSTTVSRPTLITVALSAQAIGIALPAVTDHPVAGVFAAVLFGSTFMAVTTLSLATGTHLGVTRAIPLLTAGYGVGQILGPLIVAPLLTEGYQPALLAGGVLVLVAALSSALMRIGFPR